jgi:hypothetical protein
LSYIFFLVYLLLLCRCIIKMRFVKNAGISQTTLLLLFLLKVAAGLVLGWVTYYVLDRHNDYWEINTESWTEYQLLWNNPKLYFTNLFQSGYTNGYSGFFDSVNSFWNDLRNNILIKILSVFNLLSRGNYYINSLFFNCFTFLGHIAFYRVFISIYPRQKIQVLIGCFLLPSMLYFTAGVQKDALIFSLLGFICYAVFTALQKNSFTVKKIIGIIAALVLILFVRSYVTLALAPALLVLIIIYKFKLQAARSFFIAYAVLALLFFGISYVMPSVSPMQAVVNKQQAYLNLAAASTQVKLDTLQPTVVSFLKTAPQAFSHTLLRPHITDLATKNLLPLATEVICYHIIFIIWLFRRHRNTSTHPFIYFGLLFTLTVFLLIGYIVPSLGAIVRYRSLYLVFLITPLLCSINWPKASGF